MGKWLVVILGAVALGGCADAPAPDAPVLAQAGDSWIYEPTVGDKPGWSTWVAESGSVGWSLEQVRGRSHAVLWGDAEGVRGQQTVTLDDPTYQGTLLYDRGCWNLWQAHFVPDKTTRCRALEHVAKGEDSRTSTASPQIDVRLLGSAQVTTLLGTFTAQGVRVTENFSPDGGWSGIERRIYWLAPELCAPIRVDAMDAELVVASWELAGARCGPHEHGTAPGKSPVAIGEWRLDLRHECAWDLFNAPIINPSTLTVHWTNSMPNCLIDEFDQATLHPDAAVEVGVSWTSDLDAPNERTLRAGQHAVSGTAPPLVMDVPFADLMEVEKLVVEAVPPDSTGVFTFHLQYRLDDFPLVPTSPVTFG